MNKSTNTDIRYRLWELLERTNAHMDKYADVKLLKENGISYQQFQVLLMIDRIGASATGTQIADMLGKNQNTLSQILDRMMESGLVRRERDMENRRCVRIVMTRKGEKKHKETAESGWKIIEQIAETFTEEDLPTFVSLTEKLQGQICKVLAPAKI